MLFLIKYFKGLYSKDIHNINCLFSKYYLFDISYNDVSITATMFYTFLYAKNHTLLNDINVTIAFT